MNTAVGKPVDNPARNAHRVRFDGRGSLHAIRRQLQRRLSTNGMTMLTTSSHSHGYRVGGAAESLARFDPFGCPTAPPQAHQCRYTHQHHPTRGNTHMASPRPFVLAVIGGAGTRQIEAPTIREAIIEAESQGGRVHAGRALDGGVPRFDDEAELEEFMRTHRSPAGGAR